MVFLSSAVSSTFYASTGQGAVVAGGVAGGGGICYCGITKIQRSVRLWFERRRLKAEAEENCQKHWEKQVTNLIQQNADLGKSLAEARVRQKLTTGGTWKDTVVQVGTGLDHYPVYRRIESFGTYASLTRNLPEDLLGNVVSYDIKYNSARKDPLECETRLGHNTGGTGLHVLLGEVVKMPPSPALVTPAPAVPKAGGIASALKAFGSTECIAPAIASSAALIQEAVGIQVEPREQPQQELPNDSPLPMLSEGEGKAAKVTELTRMNLVESRTRGREPPENLDTASLLEHAYNTRDVIPLRGSTEAILEGSTFTGGDLKWDDSTVSFWKFEQATNRPVLLATFVIMQYKMYSGNHIFLVPRHVMISLRNEEELGTDIYVYSHRKKAYIDFNGGKMHKADDKSKGPKLRFPKVNEGTCLLEDSHPLVDMYTKELWRAYSVGKSAPDMLKPHDVMCFTMPWEFSTLQVKAYQLAPGTDFTVVSLGAVLHTRVLENDTGKVGITHGAVINDAMNNYRRCSTGIIHSTVSQPPGGSGTLYGEIQTGAIGAMHLGCVGYYNNYNKIVWVNYAASGGMLRQLVQKHLGVHKGSLEAAKKDEFNMNVDTVYGVWNDTLALCKWLNIDDLSGPTGEGVIKRVVHDFEHTPLLHNYPDEADVDFDNPVQAAAYAAMVCGNWEEAARATYEGEVPFEQSLEYTEGKRAESMITAVKKQDADKNKIKAEAVKKRSERDDSYYNKRDSRIAGGQQQTGASSSDAPAKRSFDRSSTKAQMASSKKAYDENKRKLQEEAAQQKRANEERQQKDAESRARQKKAYGNDSHHYDSQARQKHMHSAEKSFGTEKAMSLVEHIKNYAHAMGRTSLNKFVKTGVRLKSSMDNNTYNEMMDYLYYQLKRAGDRETDYDPESEWSVYSGSIQSYEDHLALLAEQHRDELYDPYNGQGDVDQPQDSDGGSVTSVESDDRKMSKRMRKEVGWHNAISNGKATPEEFWDLMNRWWCPSSDSESTFSSLPDEDADTDASTEVDVPVAEANASVAREITDSKAARATGEGVTESVPKPEDGDSQEAEASSVPEQQHVESTVTEDEQKWGVRGKSRPGDFVLRCELHTSHVTSVKLAEQLSCMTTSNVTKPKNELSDENYVDRDSFFAPEPKMRFEVTESSSKTIEVIQPGFDHTTEWDDVKAANNINECRPVEKASPEDVAKLDELIEKVTVAYRTNVLTLEGFDRIIGDFRLTGVPVGCKSYDNYIGQHIIPGFAPALEPKNLPRINHAKCVAEVPKTVNVGTIKFSKMVEPELKGLVKAFAKYNWIKPKEKDDDGKLVDYDWADNAVQALEFFQRGRPAAVSPPTGPNDIIQSLNSQLVPLSEKRLDPDTAHVLAAGYPAVTINNKEGMRSFVARQMRDISLEKGCGWCISPNRNTKRQYLQSSACDFELMARLVLYSVYDMDVVAHATPWDQYRMGLILPEVHKIKDEPHGHNKVDERRWRVIWMTSISMELITRMFHGDQNRAEVACYQEGLTHSEKFPTYGTACGLGHDNESLRTSVDAFKRLTLGLEHGGVQSDRKSWDMLVSRALWLACGALRAILVHAAGGPRWLERGQMIIALTMSAHLFKVGNYLFQAVHFGRVGSGFLSTAADNSKMVQLSNFDAGVTVAKRDMRSELSSTTFHDQDMLFTYEMLLQHPEVMKMLSLVMGDDCVNRELPADVPFWLEHIRSLGIKMTGPDKTDLPTVASRRSVNFTSHIYDLEAEFGSATYYAAFDNYKKIAWKLAIIQATGKQSTLTPDRIRGIQFACRNIPWFLEELQEMINVIAPHLADVRWEPGMTVDLSGFL